MKTNIQVIIISFVVLKSSFLGAMECPMEFNKVNWEEFGALHSKTCDIDSVSVGEGFPEILVFYKEELTKILQRYKHGVAMNKNLDERLMGRLHEIQRVLNGKCEWYNQFMKEVRESRILGALKAVNTYREYLSTHMVAIEDSSVEINEEEGDPLTRMRERLDAAINHRMCEIEENAESLPRESRQNLELAAEVESLLSVVRSAAASRT